MLVELTLEKRRIRRELEISQISGRIAKRSKANRQTVQQDNRNGNIENVQQEWKYIKFKSKHKEKAVML